MHHEELVLVLALPCHLHVEKWIVGDIKRVRDFPQTLTDSHGTFVRYLAASTYHDKEGEETKDADALVETIHPHVGLSTNSWHDEDNCYAQ